MASIELLDEETLNVTLSDDIGLESNINEPESINVEQLPNDYTPSYTESDPIFVSSPAANIKEDDITNWNSKSDFDGDYESLTNKPIIPTVPTNLSSFTDDLGSSPTHTHSQYLTEHQDISGKVDKETGKGLSSNDFTDTYKNNVDSNTSARHTHSNKSVLDDISSSDVSSWDSKQEALVSGTNIKTINNQSLLGSGNITIQGGGGGTATDVQINGTSITSNDVANIITEGTYNASTNKIATKNDIPKIFYVDTDTTTYTYSQINGLIEDGYEIKLKTDMYMGEGYGYTICNMIYCDEDQMYFCFIDWDCTGDFTYSFINNEWNHYEETFCSETDKVFYSFSATEADTQVKVVSCYGFKLQPDAKIFIKFTNGNTYNGTAQLNINNTGAKDIAVVGNTKTSRYYWSPGEVVGFVYDGTNFVMLGKGTASTTYYGVTKLTDSVSSTSTDTSATPNSVKQAYDLANSKQDAITNNNKLSYSLLSGTPTIPDELSDLSDDSTHRLVTDTEKSTWNAKSDFSGSYTDLTDKPTIPTKTSDITNDSGFITSFGNAKTYYGTSSTSASTAAKVATCSGFTLETGATIFIKFTNGNSYNGTATLNVNSTGAKTICSVGTTETTRYYWKSGEVVGFVYDGTNYTLIEKAPATTTYYGITKLSSSTSSTSEALAATPKAVKTAYDLADSKQDAITNDNKLDYALLSNTPTIPTVNDATLTIQKNSTTIDTFSANASSNKTINITVPTNNNELTNGAGYITGITSSDVTNALGYTPEKATTLIIDYDFDFLSITSTSDSIFQDIKDAIDNEKSFKILYEDFTDSSKYYFDTDNYKHIKHYGAQPESYSFCYMDGGLCTEVKYTINGTSITTTTTEYSKQDELVSGTNIKTINGNSILGSGNLTINASAEVNNLLVALGLDTDTYSTSTTYAVGDTVVYNNTVYECNTANTTGTWDSTKWDLVPIIVND